MTTKTTPKKPVLAAILNVLIPGVGYLYVGARKNFAWILVAASVMSVFAFFDPRSIWYFGNESPQLSVWDILAALLLLVAFAYDAYTEAKKSKK